MKKSPLEFTKPETGVDTSTAPAVIGTVLAIAEALRDAMTHLRLGQVDQLRDSFEAMEVFVEYGLEFIDRMMG